MVRSLPPPPRMVIKASRLSNLNIFKLALSHLFVYYLAYFHVVSITFATSKSGGDAAADLTNTAFFDKIHQILYKKAISPPSPLLSNRTKFTLEGWKRGTGGLDDADRKTLGDLYYGANSVFEYGLGESTLIAAHTGVPRYAGVDSDAAWVALTRDNFVPSHFRFNFADIGATKAWGHPNDESLQKIHYNYQLAPLVLEDEPFDVYLVDGRYRIACACVSFLHAMKTGGDMGLVRVGVHDNHYSYRGYGILKNVADVFVENKKLWVYKLKKNTTEKDLFDLWNELHTNLNR